MEQVKKLKNRLFVSDYIINFTYETKRHNSKNQKRLVTAFSEEKAKNTFLVWINCINTDKPYRAMLNVKILNIAKENTRIIEI